MNFLMNFYHTFPAHPKSKHEVFMFKALAIVYGRCHEEIGPFTDTRYIIGMLERVRMSLKKMLFD